MMECFPRAFPVGKVYSKNSRFRNQNGSRPFKTISKHCIKNLDTQRDFGILLYQQISKIEASDIADLRSGLQVKFRYSPNGKKK